MNDVVKIDVVLAISSLKEIHVLKLPFCIKHAEVEKE